MKQWSDAILSIKRYFTRWAKKGNQGRLIVYGDLHGCLDELIRLRQKIEPKEEDREVCVGDLINKGPHSKELLKYLKREAILSVRGNHEDKIIRYIAYQKSKKRNPITLNQKQESIVKELDSKNIEFLEEMPYFIQFDNVTILHGGVAQDINLESTKKEHLSKILHLRYLDSEGNFLSIDAPKSKRAAFWSEVYDGKYGFIIYGHQVFEKPKRDEYSIGIDTGCVYGGSLSAAILSREGEQYDTDSIEIVSMDAKKQYAERG